MATDTLPFFGISSYITAVVGLLATVMGITVTLNPEIGTKMWHFHLPSEQSDQSSQNIRALVLDELRLFAVREYCIGAAILAASLLGERRMLSVILMVGIPVVIVDGIVQQRQAGRGLWVHWGIAPCMALLSLTV